jgi:two-component system NtrC family sensor kinase
MKGPDMYDAKNRRQPAISEFFDGCPAPAFAIDADHVITHWNKACEYLFGLSAAEMVGTKNQWRPIYQHERPVLADLIVAGDFNNIHSKYYKGNETFRASPLIPNAFEGEDFLAHLGENGRWIYFSAAPLRDGDGTIVGAIEVMRDTSAQKLAESDLQKIRQDLEILAAERSKQLAEANKRLEEDIRQRAIVEAELTRRNTELTSLNEKLSMAQQQLLQSEKLASIGQLAAGLAHEINNPIGYIFSNFGTLETYIANLLQMLTVYEEIEPEMAASPFLEKIRQTREQVELDFLREDIHSLMSESKEGILRVRKIVQDLKDFSRIDASQEWQWVNLHDGIDSTLNIVNNEVKYKADLFKEYGNIPDIECLPSQINQVILNLVVNAAHAIQSNRGKITLRTGSDDKRVWIEVIDTGSGIAKENLTRIFDPFFTTKPVGQGTGLGLSLSYGIIQKHCGEIQVDSEIGKGTTFKVILPINQIK